ncbi:hypothetical protein K502DRAFT_362688 [Neoconidiobolus thromboides FSU 785]|nr:hypothetical protein K502DRAFT_362688 [Neoconidiobolus thromboides FSU 785]
MNQGQSKMRFDDAEQIIQKRHSMSEVTPLLYINNESNTSITARRTSIASYQSSLKKDKIGDAWHNLFSGLDIDIFDHPLLSLIPSVIIAAIIWGIPPGSDLTHTSIHVLAVFAGFILALLISSYEVSALIAIALSVLALTKNLMCKGSDGASLECNLCGIIDSCNAYKVTNFKLRYNDLIFFRVASIFTNDVVWLVFCAFHIGKAVEVSGLGKRIAMHLVAMMGSSTTGLGLSFCFAEFILAPFIPSNSARGGGVVAPIVTSVIQVIEESSNNLTFHDNSINRYLILIASQANLISSSLFLTGLAPNPLISAKAYQVFKVEFGFMQWLTGSFVPGFFTLLVTPFFLFWIVKPKGYNGEIIQNDIKSKLDTLGPVTFKEWKLIIVLMVCLTLWSTESHTGLNNALIGFLAMVTMILVDILSWEDISKNTKAWDTLFWLSGFIVLAEQLSELNISDWLGDKVAKSLISENFSPVQSSIILALIYFLSMYMFSSATGHIVALVAAFLEAGVRLDCPPFLLISLLAYFSSLCCCMTTYSTGSLAIYFGQGYVERKQWFTVGFFMALFYFSIYFTIGMAWWKLLGWW